jgi:dCMP deaminase
VNPFSPKWQRRFLELAGLIATWSKDSTMVGCVIVGENGEVLATGYNGPPRGVDDKIERLERPAKYMWTAHAEENAIANAARVGARLLGAAAFVTHQPCSRCAGMLINAGIRRVYVGDGLTSMPEEEFTVAAAKFLEAGVTVEMVR